MFDNPQKDAPEWFLEKRDKTDEMKGEITDIMGVGEEWIQQRLEQNKGFGDVAKDLSEEETVKVSALMTRATHIIDGAWARFRYDNADSEFGKANKLRFNEEQETIEVARNLPEKAREQITKIAEKLGLDREAIKKRLAEELEQ